MRYIAIFTLLFSLSACVNSVEKFYKASPNSPALSDFIPHTGPAEIILSKHEGAKEKLDSLMEEGYLYVGSSSFNGEAATNAHIQSVAQKLQAARVLFIKKYTGTEDRSFALTTPDTQTTYHSGRVNNAYSSGTTFFSGTSTTYGTTTTWIPNYIKKYEQEALFFVKRTPGGFGVLVSNLKTEQRKATSSNFGAVIAVVFKDSSAFNANLFKDDILISVDDIKIKDAKHFRSIANTLPGKNKVPVTFWRDGNVYTLYMDIDERHKPMM
ncbi:PDZ domain-containing protein [Terasakiella sp. SH-1]|uniref:PDZ domain-containing protein n=1 Tax=Terasakiella sp. SH-1 TaxID=2560057 RepID=UPI00142F4F2D|nr:PDZ domain-containing protein [Terasakiella sp. SH-1]